MPGTCSDLWHSHFNIECECSEPAGARCRPIPCHDLGLSLRPCLVDDALYPPFPKCRKMTGARRAQCPRRQSPSQGLSGLNYVIRKPSTAPCGTAIRSTTTTL